MFTDKSLTIQLHRPSGVTKLDVQTDRALVGSGAHCDVRLAPDEAAVEQLTIELRDDEVYAKVHALEPVCRLNGAPFLEGRLSPDSVLELSAVAIKVELTEVQVRKQAKKSSSQTHPAVQGLALLAVAAGLVYVLEERDPRESALRTTVAAPSLTIPPAGACPQAEQGAARSLAELASEEAESKAERSPFYPSDGVLAVLAYERAAACHEVAQQPELASEWRRRALSLREELQNELHLRHVRLERFLAEAKYEAAFREVKLVSEFVTDRSAPYAQWLSAVRREVEVLHNMRPEG